MARSRGGSRKGIPNKKTQAQRQSLEQYCDSKHVDPHFFMVDIIADPEAPLDLRASMAKEVAQYMRSKLKAVEHTGSLDSTVQHIIEVVLE